MNITFVMAGGFSLSGGDRVIATYAKHLRQRGHQVSVIACPPQPLGLRHRIRTLVREKKWLTSKPRNLSHFDHLAVPHVQLDRCRPVQDSDVPDADVVIATWWETAEWVAQLSLAKGAKAYLIQHHEVFDYMPKERVVASYTLPLHKIVVSQWLADVMRTTYGDHHTSLVRNSVDLEQFNAPPRCKQSPPTVGLIYSKIPWKACEIGLEAFTIAVQRCPHLKLLVFGNGALSPALPLPDSAEFICNPPPAQLKHLYAQCDAWLLSSRSEGFGLPILEAMACRTPVISTAVGAAPELLAQGGGILVQPDNPTGMAKAIEQVYQLSDAEWLQMSDIAYAQATGYTWDDATTEFEMALRTAIDRQRDIASSHEIVPDALISKRLTEFP